jgi:hypothetical protein
MKFILSLILIPLLATAGPLFGEPTRLYSVPGAFQVRTAGPEASLEFLDERGGEVTRYVLSDCQFSPDTQGTIGGDGVFELIFPGVAEPMVAVACHPAGGGQRFSIFAPARDRMRPILEVFGDSFVHYAIRPGALELTRDAGGSVRQELWHSGIEANASDLGSVRDLMAAAAGRRTMPAKPVADPEFHALADRLAEIAASRNAEALAAMAASDIRLSFGGDAGVDSFRRLIAEPGFWPGFQRVLDGGGVPMQGRGSGRNAVFPALFQNWSGDLDAYEHYYGDRPGAQLRAGPSGHAPAIAELYGRIVVRGPYLEAFYRLLDDGWMHVCTMAEGCGFAREQHIRSPIDWRAIFSQAQPGAPWVLETYIAGD